MAAEVKRRRGYTRVSRKHQVTLPAAVLAEANLQPGDELHVSVDERGRVVLAAAQDPLEVLIGAAPGLSAETDLDASRNEWDA